MAQTLPVSRLIQVSVALNPQAAAGRNFGDLLIVGDSNIISGLERLRSYSSATDVAVDFGANAPETLAAELYFGQKPQPTALTLGRWIRTATHGMLEGAILTVAQSAIALFNQITSGGFTVSIDGTVHNVTGLNFSTALNLNGVASTITAALSGAGTAVWTGSQFILSSNTSGAGVDASGTITFTANPSPGDTVTVNGVSIQFVASGPTGNQVLIGGTDLLTAVNLNTFLTNSVNPSLLVATYAVVGLVVTVTYGTVGTGGNAFTLAKVSTAITLSGATLSGGTNASSVSYATSPGSGQDVSSLLGWTVALALPLIPGYSAESALQAIIAMDAQSTAWYGLTFASSVMPSDADNLAIAPFIEADPITRLFGITIQNTNVLSSLVSNDLASLLMAEGFDQTFTQYSTSSPYAVTSMFGRLFSVNFAAQNSTITLMYKQEPGALPENLATDQANVLQAKHCNVYAAYNNSTSLIQYGTVASGQYIDTIFNVDWIQNAIQTADFNVNYTSLTKVPQTDDGTNQFVNATSNVCQLSVFNGMTAPGVWNGPSFGQIVTGQFLKLGYYVFAQPIAQQSQSDRAARVSPPIQVALTLAGANHTVSVLISVNP